MEPDMKKVFVRFAALFLAAAICVCGTWTVSAASSNRMVRVGLAYGSGALVNANLENNTGYGSGYRFGYYDDSLNFVELGRTSQSQTALTMIKTQNTWVLKNGSSYTYSNSDNGGSLIGCYHIQMPGSYSDYSSASAAAAGYSDGFVAWIDGEYQVRTRAYATKEDAQAALGGGEGTVVGTSSYGVNVTATGSTQILFQFDGGSARALGIMPDVTGAGTVRTWFKGYRYYGGFRYERINGGNLTVVNIVDMETYIKGVVPYEMSNSWPLEALKAQAICARSYAYNNILQNKHKSYHFDVCNTTDCQVYCGAGSNSSSYQANARTDQAVEATAGQYGWYDGSVIEAYYSASHGGASESVANVWGSSLSTYPYLCGVTDPYEADMADKNSYSSWTVSYTTAQLTSRLQSKGYGVGTSVSSLTLTYSDLGNVIAVKVNFENGKSNTFKPTTIRSVFGVSSIRFNVNGQGAGSGSSSGSSSASGNLPVNGSGSLSDQDSYSVISGSGSISSVQRDDLYAISGSGAVDKVDSQTSSGGGSGTPSGTTVQVSGSSYSFNGSGNGHQLGMSQWGAYAMANRGYTYDQIIEFYYPGTYVK